MGQSSGSISAQRLIEYFEHHLNAVGSSGAAMTFGDRPTYPLLLVFLGDEAKRGYPSIYQLLSGLWPQYGDEIAYLAVTEQAGSLQYERLLLSGGEILGDAELRLLLPRLTSADNHFEDTSRKLIYYIVNTSALEDANEFAKSLSWIGDLKRKLRAHSSDTLEMLFALVDEIICEPAVTFGVCKALAELGENGTMSVVALSNVLERGQTLQFTSDGACDWLPCYQILVGLVALSSCSDSYVVSNLFQREIKVVGFAIEQLPTEAIGQVVVEELIDYLSENSGINLVSLPDGSNLTARLGISHDGILPMVSEYVNKEIAPKLPTPELLELLPRRDWDDYGPISSLGASYVDELTMGTWKLILNNVAKAAMARFCNDSSLRGQWIESYRSYLSETFSLDELISLGANMDEVKRLLSHGIEPSEQTPCVDYPVHYITWMLSSSNEVQSIVLEAIEQQARYAKKLREAWNELCSSRRMLHQVRDRDLVSFFHGRMATFLNRNGSALCQSLLQTKSLDDLQEFLEKTERSVVNSDRAFTYTLPDMLSAILANSNNPMAAQQYIEHKLTGNNVRRYFNLTYPTQTAMVSAILLEANKNMGSAYSSLKANLPRDTVFYDTGNPNVMEALHVFVVAPEDLISGRE